MFGVPNKKNFGTTKLTKKKRNRIFKMKTKINRNKKKLQIREQIENLGQSFDYQNLAELIQWLEKKRLDYIAQGFSDIELRFESGGWDDPYDLVICGVREETDMEYSARMKTVEKEKQKEAAQMQEHRKFIETEAKKLGILK